MTEFDESAGFDAAVVALVGTHEEAACILRAADQVLKYIAHPTTHPYTELAVPLMVERLGLKAEGVMRLYHEFADGDMLRTTALLMSAHRSFLTGEVMQQALADPVAAAQLKQEIPRIYIGIQHFIAPHHLDVFIETVSTPSVPQSDPSAQRPRGNTFSP